MLKTISAIFLISFFAMNTCLEISPMNVELLPNESSSAKLVEIMVEVKTEGDVKTIGGFLDELRGILNRLVNAQNKHRQIHAKMMKQCTEEYDFRKKEIRTARIALKNALSARTKCQASLKQAVKELPLLQSTLKTYVNELRRALAQRNVERKKYLERRSAFLEAIKFLREFITLVHNRAGKQLKAFALSEMSQTLLKHSAKLNLMTEAVPVFVALASERRHNDYSYRHNQGLGARLRATLNQLVARLNHDSNENDRVERAAVVAFNKYKNRLDKVINTLRKNIKRVKQQIVNMTRCIDEETKIITAASKKIARNSLLLSQANKMCKSFNKEFIEATYNRLDEIKTMNEILVIVGKRFAKLPKDLINYLERVKNGWIKYVNSTQFQKFKEYERKRYAVNKRGSLLARSEADKDRNPVAAVVRGRHGIY